MPSRSGVRINNGVHTTRRTTKPTNSRRLWVVSLTPDIYTKNRIGFLVCHKSNWRNTVGMVISVLGLDVTSLLIGSGLPDHPCSPVRAIVDCCKLFDLFGCRIMDSSTTRIPTSSITDCHPWPTCGLISLVGHIPLLRCNRRIPKSSHLI